MNQQEPIKQLYLSGMGGTSIAKQLNLTPGQVYNALSKLNIPRRDHRTKGLRYSCDDTVFDTIDTEEKAYWLGFLFADGFIDNQRSLGLSLGAQDAEHVEKFKTFMQATHPIHRLKVTTGYKPGAEYVRILIRSPKLCDALEALGFRKGMMRTAPTNLPLELRPAWIRGLFDGDGDLGVTKSYPYRRFRISGTTERLAIVADWLEMPRQICKDKSVASLSYSGKTAIKPLQMIYEGATIYLNRKYAQYLEVKSTVEATLQMNLVNSGKTYRRKSKATLSQAAQAEGATTRAGSPYTQASGSARHLERDDDIVCSSWKHEAAFEDAGLEVATLN